MKLQGRKLDAPKPIVIPICRDDGDLYFKAQAVNDLTKFREICPPPQPRQKILPGGERTNMIEEPDYKKKLDEYATQQSRWMILESLKATEGLEWDTVKYEDPTTWKNYENDLRSAGLTDAEIGRVINGVLEANGLDETKVELAKQRFLQDQRAAAE